MKSHQLINEFWPYAKRSSKYAARKWDIDEDDTFQTIMMDAWRCIEWAMGCKSPIAALRSKIRFSIGHLVQSRYWRRGNGETDQFADGFEVEDKSTGSIEEKIDIDRALSKLPSKDIIVVMALVNGYSMADVSRYTGEAHTTVAERLRSAKARMQAALAGGEIKSRGEVLSFISDNGMKVSGKISKIMEFTGLSKGSVHNIRSGKRESINGWRLVV